MKQILACIALVTILYSCKTGLSGSPKGTVESFIEASKTGNLDEIKKYITKSDVSLIEMGQSFMGNLDSVRGREMKEKMAEKFREKTRDAKIDVKNEKVDGNNATVDVEFTHDGKTDTHPFSLVKEDGQWKISLLSTGMKNSGSNDQDTQEAMKNLNLDSLKGTISKGMADGMKELDKIDKDSLKKAMKDAMKEVDKLGNDSLKKAIKDGMKELEKLKEDRDKN